MDVKRQWPPNTHRRLAEELAKYTHIQKKFSEEQTNKSLYNFLTATDDIPYNTSFQDTIKLYAEKLNNTKTYETSHILDAVYFNFTQKPSQSYHSKRINEEDYADPQSGFSKQLYFILILRQYIRILRRLKYFSFFRQRKLEETTYYDNHSGKIFHSFYENIVQDNNRENRMAKVMSLQNYSYKLLQLNLDVQEAEETSTAESFEENGKTRLRLKRKTASEIGADRKKQLIGSRTRSWR